MCLSFFFFYSSGPFPPHRGKRDFVSHHKTIFPSSTVIPQIDVRLLTFHGLNPSTRCPRSFTEVTKPAELEEWECRGLFNGLWGCFCHFSCQARRTNVKQPLCFQAVANCRGTFLSSAHTKTDNIQHNIQHMRAMLENKEPWGRNSIRLCVCCVCFGRLECTLMLILYM